MAIRDLKPGDVSPPTKLTTQASLLIVARWNDPNDVDRRSLLYIDRFGVVRVGSFYVSPRDGETGQ